MKLVFNMFLQRFLMMEDVCEGKLNCFVFEYFFIQITVKLGADKMQFEKSYSYSEQTTICRPRAPCSAQL